MSDKHFFTQKYIDFFIELAANNNKEWFDINRTRYENDVREPFKKFVNHMINKIAVHDKRYKELDAKDCIFRINRDIRFSKDKTPYKTFLSAVLSPLGKKSDSVHGIYFEFGPEFIDVYGGIYEMEKSKVEKIREYIANDTNNFQKIYNNNEFKKLYGDIRGLKNKIIPTALKESAKKEPLIYNKQWYFYTQFSTDMLLVEELDNVLMNCFQVGKPLEDYFNKIINRK